jgi:formate hydrogenlyase subunit 4
MYSIILIFIASLFFLGIVNRTKAVTAGRKGAGYLQPIYDVLRLFNKESVYSTTSSFVFKIAPTVYFVSVALSVLLIPFGKYPAVLAFDGDFVFFAYLLGAGKFMMILSAMDTGSAFEGMGANREALYSMLVEPAFFILMGSFAMLTGYTSFTDIYYRLHFSTDFGWLLGLIAGFVLVQIAMVENSRLPIDDPKTHLELTMVHEVMILDNSGFDLGLILYTSALKFSIFGLLICNFLINAAFSIDVTIGGFMLDLSLLVNIGIFLLVQIVFAILVGILESFRARERMKKNPQFIFGLSALSIVIFFGILIWMHKFNY